MDKEKFIIEFVLACMQGEKSVYNQDLVKGAEYQWKLIQESINKDRDDIKGR